MLETCYSFAHIFIYFLSIYIVLDTSLGTGYIDEDEENPCSMELEQ